MKISRPFRAAASGLVRLPRAIGRGAWWLLRSRVLPWSLVVVALGAAGFFARQWDRAEQREDRRIEVVEAARTFLVALTNFQAATIDRDVDRIRSFAVGDFADQVDTFFGPKAVDAIKGAEAKSVGRVQSVFVQSLVGDTASVFGVVDETVTNNRSSGPSVEVVRFSVQMIRTAAGWRVSSVEILQSPGGNPLGG